MENNKSKKTGGFANKKPAGKNPKQNNRNKNMRTDEKKAQNVRRPNTQNQIKRPKANTADRLKAQKPEKGGKNVLKVRFLGGVGEIGKNMTALEYGNDIVVIDAGLTFPTEDMPGVDLLIPDVQYLEENKHRVKGYVITHGHEDHIGGLPYVLKDVNAPVYGSKLTLALIENKLKEHRLPKVKLCPVSAGSVVRLGAFSVEFVGVNHSIAGAMALSITTPVGVVFHSGDFKVDYTPISGDVIDLSRMAEIGKKGVTLLLAESTNVEREGFTMSESVVAETLDKLFTKNAGKRLIVATFASNVHRIEQILELSAKHKRKVVLSGRSMLQTITAASEIGEMKIPENTLIDVSKMKSFAPEHILILSTGTQGEPMSALTRMASDEFSGVTIGSGDTVVISASVIPGNERMIYGVINNLYKKGAEVVYDSLEPIHVSGHACREELKLLHTLLKPRFFVPVHGEYRHLKKHQQLAEELGMKKGSTLIAEIGDTVEVSEKSLRFGNRFKAGTRLVDGVGIDGEDSVILRDRIHLSEDGLLVVVVCVDELSGTLVSTEIINKGVNISDDKTKELREQVETALDKVNLRGNRTLIKDAVRRSLKNDLFRSTKKNPMILPVIMEV